jgi:three-Cys-motif partner protein
MTEHRFGGIWTEIKLETVIYYLECYTKALSHRDFDLWYIDAFAGTGSRTVEQVVGGLFQQQPISLETAVLAGSARRALAVTPRFHHFLFIEKEPERFMALEALKVTNPTRDIACLNVDANVKLRALTESHPWNLKDRGRARGVVFLDPYALQVEWATLKALAASRVMDVWYLFPIRDVVRQLAHDFRGIGPKEPTLDLVLGPDWRQLYKDRRPDDAVQLDMLSTPSEHPQRDADMRDIEQWFKTRLEGIFQHVTDPLQVLSAPGRQAFSLFLAISNPSTAAINLAKQFAKHAMISGERRASR